METEVMDLEKSKDQIEEDFREIKVSKKKSVKLKHDGISEDFEKAIDGKEIGRYKKKSLYKDTDTVDEMTDETIELIADSSRKLIKRAEKSENEKIKELVNKEYSPSSNSNECENQEVILRSALNIF